MRAPDNRQQTTEEIFVLIEENLDNWQAFDPFIYEHSPIVYIRNV